jgi:hypothetical protein
MPSWLKTAFLLLRRPYFNTSKASHSQCPCLLLLRNALINSLQQPSKPLLEARDALLAPRQHQKMNPSMQRMLAPSKK